MPAEASGLRPWRRKRFTMKENAVGKQILGSPKHYGKPEAGNTEGHAPIPIFKRTFATAVA